MANFHIYKNNPTAGGTNGTQVSEGTGLEPILTGNLNTTENQESLPIKLAIRCETGYRTVSGESTTFAPIGTTSAKWALALDDGTGNAPSTFGAYGATLTMTSQVTSVNTIFWAKAKATTDESPANDISVDLQVQAKIEAV
jgi:hypothetical protein